MSWVAVGVGVATTSVGLINKGKAKKEAARLEASRPKYQESPYTKDQLSLSKSELSNGLSAETENAYNQSTDRDLSTSLDTILKGGGSVNNIADVFDASQQGRSRLAIMKENMRLGQINNLVRAQDAQTEEDNKAFTFNQWQPWADKAQANAQARQGAESQIWGGLSTIAGGAMKPQGYPQQEAPTSYMSQVSSAPARQSTGYAMGNTGNIDLSGLNPSINIGG